MNTPYQATASKTNAVLDAASRGASAAVDGAARAAHPAIDALASSAAQVRDNAAPALRELAHDAEGMARHGASVVRDRALDLRDASVVYVRAHPLQTVLIAAGVGAALALLTRMLSGSHHDETRRR